MTKTSKRLVGVKIYPVKCTCLFYFFVRISQPGKDWTLLKFTIVFQKSGEDFFTRAPNIPFFLDMT
eukprot:snap_masked-scaffold_6-processed-gene-13.32-mRNA-1 protein AED:1.00 eAED:1.00 QI:0/0/0/0/1/1/2/0/65